MDKKIVKILGQLKPKKQQGGAAFEYAMARALEHLLQQKAEKAGRSGQSAAIEHSPRVDMLRKAFDNLPVITGRKAKVVDCAKRAAESMVRKFPDLEGPIRLISDDAGRETEDGAGDVCDMEIGRSGGRFLGISCKLNNDELKHPRMSATSNLEASCFDTKDGEWVGAARQAEIFREIEKAAMDDPDQNLTWKNWKEGGEGKGLKLIQELKTMTFDAIRRQVDGGGGGVGGVGGEAARTMEFVLGTRDYVLVRADDKNKDPKVELRYHNPRATLGGGIAPTALPRRISRVLDDSDKDGAAFVMMLEGEDGGESLGLRFRLHSASTSVQPSLKWSVKWAVAAPGENGKPKRMLKKHCWEAEEVGMFPEDSFGEDFLPALPANDEVALLVANAGFRGREGIEDFSALCSMLPLSREDRVTLEGKASVLLTDSGSVVGRADSCLGLLTEALGADRLPSRTMVGACAARVAAENGRPLEAEEMRVVQDAVFREAMTEAKSMLAGRCADDEAEKILGNLLPPSPKPFRFGMSDGSRAKNPSATQLAKNTLCEGWWGEDSPLRRALQSVAVLVPSLVGKTEEEKAAGLGSTREIWKTIQEDIGEWRPISMTPQTWEKRLDGFAAEVTRRILVSPDGEMDATKTHEAVLVALAGYNSGDRYTPGFPFGASGEEQDRWIDSLPRRDDGGWDGVKVGARSRLWRMEVWPEDVGRVARKTMELMREEDLGGDAMGTALLAVSLDGRPLTEVFGKLARQIGCNGGAELAEAAGKFGISAEDKFNATDVDQCQRLAGAMAVAGGSVSGRGGAPSEILLLAVVGTADADSVRRAVGQEVEKSCAGCMGAEEDAAVVSRASRVAMGEHGLVQRPYPVSGTYEERGAWRADLKSGHQSQFVLPEPRPTSERGGNALVKRDDVTRACDKLDELWSSPDGHARQALEAYAISVLGARPGDIRSQRVGASKFPAINLATREQPLPPRLASAKPTGKQEPEAGAERRRTP